MTVRLTQDGTTRLTQDGTVRLTQDAATPSPTLLTPVDDAHVNLLDGETFTWNHNGAGAQDGFAFRRRVPGGDWEWWNGTGWQSTEIFITSAVESLTIPAGDW